MNAIILPEVKRLMGFFPDSRINHNFELVLIPKENVYFLLEDVNSILELNCKVLEWLSRPAHKGTPKNVQALCLSGINGFLGTNFTSDDISTIYTNLGNCVNRALSIQFAESNYNTQIL